MSETPQDVIYIGLWAYVRTMLLILWAALRHPFSTTRINMLTGECEVEA